MKSFFVALVILGCTLSCAFATGCKYPHKGDGGVMNKNGEYIPGTYVSSGLSLKSFLN